jgi:hypothetical protein
MPTTRFTIAAAMITLMLVVGLPRPAAAQAIGEPLMYPGSNCFRVTGGIHAAAAGSTNPLDLSTTHGTLTNNATTATVVQCPMYDNGVTFIGRVWVIDNTTTANITCCSKCRNPLGNPHTNQCKSTSGNSNTAKALDFDGPSGSSLSSGCPGTFSYRFYDCTLPGTMTGSTTAQPPTRIINYRGRAQ